MKIVENVNNSQLKDEYLPRLDTAESDRELEEEHKASKKGKEKNDGEASDTKHNKDSNNNEENDSQGVDTGETGDADQSTDDDSTASATDDENNRQIYDGNGNIIDLPENVNSVVVTGDAAPIVQMLGGKGIISGTAASFMSDSFADQVFGGELGETKTLWNDDGSSTMSSSNFETLLSMKPDVCVTISGQSSFSSSQMETLKEKKIAVVALPALNSYENIQNAVAVVGEMIGDRSGEDGGINAAEKAAEYVDYCDSLISEVTSKTGMFTWNNKNFNTGENDARNTASNGQYTLYISDWDNASYQITNNNGTVLYQDSGVAVAQQGYSESPLSYFLSVAGVCNNGARFVQNTRSEYAISPLNRNVFKHSVSGSYPFYGDTTESFARVKSDAIDIGLGEDGFKTIIVENASIKNSIKNSSTWESKGKVTVNSVTDYGFTGNDGSLITSYIRGNYEIIVNPAGVGSWSGGSVESVLESVWAAWKFHDAYSEGQVKEKVKSFYSKFYRYDLTDSQVNAILSGK